MAKPKQTYMPGLDVLRGLAISMVLLLHGLARNNGAVFRQYHSAAWSALEISGRGWGVRRSPFFALSGLLITGILLDTKGSSDYYQQFSVRRVLRILPAYLLIIAVLVIFHWITWKYVLVCLLGPVLRFGLLQLHGPAADFSKKTWGVADFFAAGALISVAQRVPRARPFFRRVGLLLLLAGLLLLSLSGSWHPKAPHLAQLQAATSFNPWLILFSGLVLALLHWLAIAHQPLVKPLLFLSRISYGLYLCHQLIFTLVERYWPSHPAPAPERFPWSSRSSSPA